MPRGFTGTLRHYSGQPALERPLLKAVIVPGIKRGLSHRDEFLGTAITSVNSWEQYFVLYQVHFCDALEISTKSCSGLIVIRAVVLIFFFFLPPVFGRNGHCIDL